MSIVLLPSNRSLVRTNHNVNICFGVLHKYSSTCNDDFCCEVNPLTPISDQDR